MEKKVKQITSKKAKVLHEELKSYWSDESKLSQKILISCLDKLEQISDDIRMKDLVLKEVLEIRKLVNEIKLKEKKPKRKPSEWNLFVGKYFKEGKTIKEASTDWKKNH